MSPPAHLAPGSSGAPDAAAAAPPAAKGKALTATIRRTRFGVPHITAPNMESLAAGYAFAFAQDNICTIASEFMTLRAQRSRYFGPDAEWTVSATGLEYPQPRRRHLLPVGQEADSLVEKLVRRRPPLGPKPAIRRGVRGFVRGYNAYLRRTGVDNLPDPRCRGKAWVKPIRPIDVYRRVFQLGILVSSSLAIGDIVNAEPVTPRQAEAQGRRMRRMFRDGDALSALQPEVGSNAYAFGSQATQNGKGLLLGNPHFPWQGSERLYQAHLTIPGQMDVAGASLYGAPLIVIGHTRGLAWSHTVATAWRFTPFRLTLAPGDPHSYIVDGEVRPIRREEVRVMARKPGGGLERRTGFVNTTEYGPIFTGLVGIPLPLGRPDRVRPRRPQRLELPLHQPLHRQRPGPVRAPVQPHPAPLPGAAVGQLDRRRLARQRLLHDAGGDPLRRRRKGRRSAASSPATEVLGLPILDGSRSECNWDDEPRGGRSRHLPAERRADALPPRLRPQRQRQPLAHQPRAPADRL